MKQKIKVIILFLIYGMFFNSVFCAAVQEQIRALQRHLSKGISVAVNKQKMQQDEAAVNGHVHVLKTVLDNGLTVLVHPLHVVPKVSIQLWYGVGSMHEKERKGIAHLIEHMIFKGTSGKDSLNLSESDINILTHKLSGNINAFTSTDYTGYLFNFPTHHWKEALPIMADCMRNVAFKEDHLSSEMKAVIQELKMRKDNYTLALAQNMMTAMFNDHPYHYPVIGYKQDLWDVHSEYLREFYKKYYVPNNATLVVVGDVQPDEVFALAKKYFEPIPAIPCEKNKAYFTDDIAAKTATIYRDVQVPTMLLAWVIPGVTADQAAVTEMLSWILGEGKASRLYTKLVDQLHIANTLGSFVWDLFEHSVFFIEVEPRSVEDADKIIALIQQEINDIITRGVSERELSRASKQARMSLYHLFENTQEQAYYIGKYFLATGDENYIFTYLDQPVDKLHADMRQLLTDYFRPSVLHKGFVLPLPASEVPQWQALQEASDAQDAKILSARVRTSPLEPPMYSKGIEAKDPGVFAFPKAEVCTLSNGLKVFYHTTDNTPKINLIIELKAQSHFDPEETQGLYNFMASMMTEGTENYTAVELANELESHGMSLSVSPGFISMSMLSSDLPKGLQLLNEVLTRATFEQEETEKVREQVLSDIKDFWDTPTLIAGQLIREHIYKGHPYHKDHLGTEKTVKAITKQQLVDLYKRFITPKGAKLAIVGDLKGYDLKKVLEEGIGSWTGPELPDLQYPVLKPQPKTTLTHYINRDQVLLAMASLSIDRKNPDYDKLLIFDQIFSGGALGSMSSRLFNLREQSGLFYSIRGSLISSADEQPGMVLISTLVSMDRLAEAEKAIKNTLMTSVDTIQPHEFTEAKHAILNSLVLNFEANGSIANAFLFLDRYGFPADFFDKRALMLADITIKDVQDAVRKRVDANSLVILNVGRLKSA